MVKPFPEEKTVIFHKSLGSVKYFSEKVKDLEKAADNLFKRQEAEFSYQLLNGALGWRKYSLLNVSDEIHTAQMAASGLAYSLVRDSVCAVTVNNAAGSENSRLFFKENNYDAYSGDG